ncbi:1-aminocyclopropane-1-carboxylate deaminase/D-cysteine desulfhydrase [Streptomyces sp. ME19-01-6]|uniref:1-aminocyclopropane-1-carboxylate deaminase/D-cysteine desulfhydrase n=1 Tax=Streptomyces sp. ME19-01-6 TaxID=3028686 RepID=UPI0029AB78DD|nr:pyridoxal-phosphate dependent enzyme [Streptomyces sp. ME19-01-6]MDX3226304.1 pyridoxal-phosphate dependent enzyme [Streptomyces sp. ME19-01-6]
MSLPIDPAVALAPRLPSPLQRVHDERLAERGVELRLKRDDLVHPTVPGNKWRKLAPNLTAALDQGHSRLLTFGGAYSNHIRAVAAAGAAVGLRTVGVIRGDELAGAPRNWSLARAEEYGMELAFRNRAGFRETLRELAEPKTAPETVRRLEERWGRCYVLPEGGTNVAAARGAAEIVAELPGLGPGDVVCCAVGTGGTLAGIAAALPEGARALGVAVVKGARYLDGEVARLHERGWGRTYPNWRIDHDHHGGGYGRVPAELAAFAEGFEERHGLAAERRYVAKMLRCVYDLAGGPALPPGSRVTAVITGPPDPVPGPGQ